MEISLFKPHNAGYDSENYIAIKRCEKLLDALNNYINPNIIEEGPITEGVRELKLLIIKCLKLDNYDVNNTDDGFRIKPSTNSR